jgi:hypothetical protein
MIDGTLRHAGPLLILAMTILCGVAFGEIARAMRIPAITGQIIAGLLLGRSGLDLFDEASLAGLQPLTQFALGLIALTVGAHLNIKRLRNAGRRLFFLLITESRCSPDSPSNEREKLAAIACGSSTFSRKRISPRKRISWSTSRPTPRPGRSKNSSIS